MVDDSVHYVPYEFDGSVGEDFDLAAVAFVLIVLAAAFGLGLLAGWVLW